MTSTSDNDLLGQHPLELNGVDHGSSSTAGRRTPSVFNQLDWRQALGGALVGIGVLAIIIAWWLVSGTPYPGEQMPPIASGGLGGAALIAVGVTLLNAFEHVKDRDALREVLDRVDDLERRARASDHKTAATLDQVLALLDGRSGGAATSRARRSPAKDATRR